jgi:hypothetical protein
MATGIKMRDDSVRSFNRAVRDVAKMSRKSGRQILAQAGFNFVQSARKATPKARANAKREVVEIDRGDANVSTRYEARSMRSRQFGVKALNQSKQYGGIGFKLLAIGSKMQATNTYLRNVPRIGAAKASWWGAFRDFKKSLPQNVVKKKLSSATEIGGEISPAVTIVNELSYLMKIAPQVESTALVNAGKQLVRRAEFAQRKQAERWARA